mgnify:CR=1 FL=1
MPVLRYASVEMLLRGANVPWITVSRVGIMGPSTEAMTTVEQDWIAADMLSMTLIHHRLFAVISHFSPHRNT